MTPDKWTAIVKKMVEEGARLPISHVEIVDGVAYGIGKKGNVRWVMPEKDYRTFLEGDEK